MPSIGDVHRSRIDVLVRARVGGSYRRTTNSRISNSSDRRTFRYETRSWIASFATGCEHEVALRGGILRLTTYS
jgi:hypothetical protein